MVMTRSKLEEKIKEILGMDTISLLIQHQISKFTTERGYSNMDIARALYYFYVEKNGDKEQAKEKGIGIVPYVMDDSREYFRRLEQEKARKLKEVQEAKNAERITVICKNPPKAKTKKQLVDIENIKEDD